MQASGVQGMSLSDYIKELPPIPASPLKHRVGGFDIDPAFIDSGVPGVREIMRSCVVVHCRFCEECDCVHYMALSPQFEKIVESGPVPKYRWVLTQDLLMGQVSAQAVRIEGVAHA